MPYLRVFFTSLSGLTTPQNTFYVNLTLSNCKLFVTLQSNLSVMKYSDSKSKPELRSASHSLGLYEALKKYAKKCRHSYLSLLSL